MKRTYNDQDIELLKQNSGKLTFEEFYILLNEKINKITLRKILKQYNIEFVYLKKQENKITKLEFEELKKIAHGMNRREIVEYFNNKYTFEYISHLCIKHNIDTIKLEQIYATEEEISWLEQNAYLYTTEEIAFKFGNKWQPKNLREIMRNRGITWKETDLSEACKIYHCNSNFFKNISTPEQMYILGLFITDGSINPANKCLKFIQKDRDIVEIIKRCLDAEQEIRNVVIDDNTYYSITFYDKVIYQDLLNLGFTNNKSYDAKVPRNLPSKFLNHLIRGMIDGDGTIGVYEKPVCGICGTKNICNYFKEVIKIIVPRTNINIRKSNGKELYVVSLSTRIAYEFLQWVYKNSDNLRMDRKYQKYLEICDYYKGKSETFEEHGEITLEELGLTEFAKIYNN